MLSEKEIEKIINRLRTGEKLRDSGYEINLYQERLHPNSCQEGILLTGL